MKNGVTKIFSSERKGTGIMGTEYFVNCKARDLDEENKRGKFILRALHIF